MALFNFGKKKEEEILLLWVGAQGRGNCRLLLRFRTQGRNHLLLWESGGGHLLREGAGRGLQDLPRAV